MTDDIGNPMQFNGDESDNTGKVIFPNPPQNLLLVCGFSLAL